MSAAWQVRDRALSLEHPLVMGIVNVTPDSFSDGGRHADADLAIAHALTLLDEGADLVDIGGESTRPQGAEPVSAVEEMRRVLPVIRGVLAERPDAVVSVDTVKGTVAEAAVSAGAHIVNDVSGGRLDATVARVSAESGAGLVVMHSRGGVADMATYQHADYDGDVLATVLAELRVRVDAALAQGVERGQLVVDPGIGFSKHPAASLRLLGCLPALVAWGFPVLVGASRKRFIGALTTTLEPALRVHGSVGAAVASYGRGARIFRVHDVAATRQALDVAAAIHAAGQPGRSALHE